MAELARGRGIEEIGPFGEGGVVLLDVGLERARGSRGVPQRRASVRATDGERHLVDDQVRDAAPVRDPVERGVLVELAHMDDPFDDLAVPPIANVPPRRVTGAAAR